MNLNQGGATYMKGKNIKEVNSVTSSVLWAKIMSMTHPWSAIHQYTYTHVCMHVRMHIHACARAHTHTCTHMFVCDLSLIHPRGCSSSLFSTFWPRSVIVTNVICLLRWIKSQEIYHLLGAHYTLALMPHS